MAYQALYRTWRPAFFRDVVGQDRIVTTLRNQLVTAHTAHAYLFCGSRGTGKTSTAKVLARAINCLSPEDGEPCGKCEACRALENENSLDVVEIDAASNNGVDEIRELREKIRYLPTVGRYKVYIIDEVHMLSTGAFNALLKTLEEPPAHVVFILATTEPQKLPATILSRCQRFDFKRIPANLLEGRMLKVLNAEGKDYEREAVSLIARAAEGGMRDALSILDMCISYSGDVLTAQTVREVLGSTDRQFMFEYAEALIGSDTAKALELTDRLMRDGRDPAVFTKEVTEHMRRLLMAKLCKDGLEDLLEITAEDAARFREQADKASQARLMRTMELFIQAENDMKWSSQQRIVLEMCAVRSCRPDKEPQNEETIEDRLSMLEKQIAEGVKLAPAQAAPASAAAAAPKQEKAASIPKPPENEAEAYKKAVSLLNKCNPRLAIMMSKVKFTGTDGNQALLSVDSEEQQKMMTGMVLGNAEKKQQLDGCLTEAFGTDMHARIVLKGQAAPKPTKESRDNLNLLFDMVPRDVIEVVDNK